MSRSYLRDKNMQKQWNGTSLWYSHKDREIRNAHRQDEAPKNHPSKFVTQHCSAYIAWIQEATSFGGHSIPKGGHRKIGGIVRAHVKRETRQEINDSLE